MRQRNVLLFSFLGILSLFMLFQLTHVSKSWVNVIDRSSSSESEQQEEEQQELSNPRRTSRKEVRNKILQKQQQKVLDQHTVHFPSSPLLRQQEYFLPGTGTDNHKHSVSLDVIDHRELVWNRSVYLPASLEAITAFRKYEQKQRDRGRTWPRIIISSSSSSSSSELSLKEKKKLKNQNEKRKQTCLSFTPECEFFLEIKTFLLLDKCCEEHRKLKETLIYTLAVARRTRHLRLFLDSGTLLSSARDGGDTLVPWETDIDLGAVGADPNLVSGVFIRSQGERHDHHKERQQQLLEEKNDKKKNQKNKKGQNREKEEAQQERRTEDVHDDPHLHYFEKCKLKVSANKSRNGLCADAHYVYHAKDALQAAIDTSRVEIWPFRIDGALLTHPTRKKLTVPRKWVEPLRHCRVWGISTLCPNRTEAYLDNEYGPTWKWPRTIHWDKNNAPPWKGSGFG